jgi:hypothetical protein
VQVKATSIVEREIGSLETGYGAVGKQQGSSADLSDAPVPLRKLLNASRVLRIANYGVLSTLEIAMYALQPLFYSTPIEFGGLGFNPMTIGLWMAAFGVANGLIQSFCFAPLVNRLGPKTLLRVGHACYIPIFGLFPVINGVAKWWGVSWVVWALLTCQMVLTAVMDMSFSAYCSVICGYC